MPQKSFNQYLKYNIYTKCITVFVDTIKNIQSSLYYLIILEFVRHFLYCLSQSEKREKQSVVRKLFTWSLGQEYFIVKCISFNICERFYLIISPIQFLYSIRVYGMRPLHRRMWSWINFRTCNFSFGSSWNSSHHRGTRCRKYWIRSSLFWQRRC